MTLAEHREILDKWRALSEDEQMAILNARDPTPKPSPALLARVNACPDRGGVLPLSQQAECGCKGKELSECRAGKGQCPGRVTTADCLACQSLR